MIRSNPYVLCIYGIDIPFVKADQIAGKLDIPRDSDNRIKAGLSCVLRENANSGHTCLPLDRFEKISCEFLGINKEQFQNILDAQIEEENLFYYYKQNRPFVMLRDFYKAEDYIARRLSVMRECSYDNKIDFSEVIDIAEEQNGIRYEALQRKAINLALSHGFLVLTGGPGTGKTTTLNAIISLYQQQGLNVMIAAPTGRAAKRISDLTGFEALVDAIDGVDFEVPINMNYDDPYQDLHIHFNAGMQHLTGEEAMKVVRFRHNNDGSGYGNEDIGRMQTQQAFLKAVAQQTLTLSNLDKIDDFVKIFQQYVETDLTLGNLAWLGKEAISMGAENISFSTLPGEWHSPYIYLDPDATLEVVNQYLNPYVEDRTMEDLNIPA